MEKGQPVAGEDSSTERHREEQRGTCGFQPINSAVPFRPIPTLKMLAAHVAFPCFPPMLPTGKLPRLEMAWAVSDLAILGAVMGTRSIDTNRRVNFKEMS